MHPAGFSVSCSTTSLGSLFHCLTTPIVIGILFLFFLNFECNFLYFRLCPLLLASLGSTEKCLQSHQVSIHTHRKVRLTPNLLISKLNSSSSRLILIFRCPKPLWSITDPLQDAQLILNGSNFFNAFFFPPSSPFEISSRRFEDNTVVLG